MKNNKVEIIVNNDTTQVAENIEGKEYLYYDLYINGIKERTKLLSDTNIGLYCKELQNTLDENDKRKEEFENITLDKITVAELREIIKENK